MLLSIFAFLVGAAIGRARGGRASAFKTIPLHKAGWLAAGISGVLIVTLIGPSQPVWWMFVTYACFAYFAVRNLHFTGMMVLLIGMMMNLIPMIANVAVPVSEQALISVGEVESDGSPVITSIRESTETATSFTFFGDVVPVPIFAVVVSLGDLVIAVALADIAMHAMLRAKARRPDDDAYSYAECSDEPSTIDLREPVSTPAAPTPTVKRHGPAHAAGRRPRMRPLTSIHVPAHAAPSKTAETKPANASNSTVKDMPPTAIYHPEHAAPADPEIVLPQAPEPVVVLNDESHPDGYLTTTAHLNTTTVDNRPIIDLTNSPTEQQLIEFMRRRAEADRALLERQRAASGEQPHRPQRQSRRAKRSNHKVEA